jgi:hypothetical protein
MSLLELFCSVDDFCQEYAMSEQGKQLGSGKARRERQGELYLSEVMTIVIHFHQSHYRDFKTYYTQHVQVYLREEFPKQVSYTRFVELMSRTLTPLALYVQRCLGQCTGLSFIDSTALVVCHNRRIHSHRVLLALPSVVRLQWAGSMASSCIWSSMTAVTYWLFV